MSTFPVEPPVTPAAPAPEAGGAVNRRELSQEEIATLPLQALLVRAGHITLDQLADALRENVATGRAVEDIALSRGWLAVEQLDALRAAKQSYAPGTPAPVAQPPAAPAPAPAPVVAAYVPPAPPPVVEAPAAPMPERRDARCAGRHHGRDHRPGLVRRRHGPRNRTFELVRR